MLKKDVYLAILYFLLSTIITWWFVVFSPMYISQEQMLLSTAIAGGKWAIQIVLGLILLKDKAFQFVREIGLVCLIGSCVLLPYVFAAYLKLWDSPRFFVGSLAVSVLTMVYFYFRGVKRVQVPIGWWLFWLLCLACAITLQLTVVFRVTE